MANEYAASQSRPWDSSTALQAVATLALAGLYYATGIFGLTIAAIGGVAGPIWPPSGISLAALLIGGRRLWPGILLGAFAVNLTVTGVPLAALGIAIGNTLEALVAFELLQRIRFDRSLSRPRDVLAFIGLAAVACTTISATIGVYVSWFFQVIPPPEFFMALAAWWLGDMLGMVLVGSLIPILAHRTHQKPAVGRILEAAALLAVVAAFCELLFSEFAASQRGWYLRSYLVFLPVLWAAIRFGVRGVVITTTVIAVLATRGTLLGYGPYAGPRLVESLLALQLFMATLSITFMFLGALVDEQRRTETRLRESEARFRRLKEADILGIFFWDLAGRIYEPNGAFLKTLGLSEAAPDLSWKTITPPEHQSADEKAIRELLTQGACTPYEKEYLRPDGTRVPVMLGGAFFEQSRDRGVAYVIDMTAIKKALRDREEVLDIVSHDLKNPIESLLLNSRLLYRSAPAGAGGKEIRELTDRIKRAASHMQKLIHDILDLRKIEAGRLSVDMSLQDAQELVGEALELLKPLSETKSIRLFADIRVERVTLYCDRERVIQVLSNIIGNAIKFTPPNGTIRVRVKKHQGLTQVSVQDTGPGIPAEALPNIFDRYRPGRKAAKYSVGLGLPIAKGIVEAHGGTLWAESKPGRGATFHFTLPYPESTF